MKGRNLVVGTSLMTVNNPAGMAVFLRPTGHAVGKLQTRQPSGTESGSWEVVHFHPRWGIRVEELFTDHMDGMSRAGQLPGQLPDIPLHPANRSISAHNVENSHWERCCYRHQIPRDNRTGSCLADPAARVSRMGRQGSGPVPESEGPGPNRLHVQEQHALLPLPADEVAGVPVL